MKIKLSIKREIKLNPDVLEEKISKYLQKNFYRVLEKGPGFIVFADDDYSDRKTSPSDFHTRIGEGKFEFHSTEHGTTVKLVYLTSVLYPFFVMMLFATVGIYAHSFMAFLGIAVVLPIAFRIISLNKTVIDEILE